MLSGSVATMSVAFGAELTMYQDAGGTFRGRTLPVYLPAELAHIVPAVTGLDNRPQVSRRLRPAAASENNPGSAFTPPEVAEIYNFPKNVTGKGQTVGIIELQGGYTADDLNAYFTTLALTPPHVTTVSVGGGQNSPQDSAGSSDAEVMMDIEIVGAVAPGSNIVVYFTPNTTQGFVDAITTAIHDPRNKPSVLAISWNAAEPAWTDQTVRACDQAFADARHMGVTICAASGDQGSGGGVGDGLSHVCFPASDPYVLGCGGTQLTVIGGLTSEVVWDAENGASGGGVSDIFERPPGKAHRLCHPQPTPAAG